MTALDAAPVPANWRALFLVAAVYDILLGASFLVAGEAILSAIGMALPPHAGYIHLSAVFIAIQGLSYWLVYRDPIGNASLVKVGLAYKGAYVGLTAYYIAIGRLPSPFFIPWAVFDLLFLIGFWLFLRRSGQPGRT